METISKPADESAKKEQPKETKVEEKKSLFEAKPAPVVNNPFARPADNPVFKKIEPIEIKPSAPAPINIFSKPVEAKPEEVKTPSIFAKPAANPQINIFTQKQAELNVSKPDEKKSEETKV